MAKAGRPDDPSVARGDRGLSRIEGTGVELDEDRGEEERDRGEGVIEEVEKYEGIEVPLGVDEPSDDEECEMVGARWMKEEDFCLSKRSLNPFAVSRSVFSLVV